MPTPLAVLWLLFVAIILCSGSAAATVPDAVLSDAPSLEERAAFEGRSIQVARRGLSFGSTRRPATPPTPAAPAVTPSRTSIDSPPPRPSTPASAQPNHALPALGVGIAVGARIERASRGEDSNAAAETTGGTFGSGNKELLLSALLGVCVFSIVLLFTPIARIFGEPDEVAPHSTAIPAKGADPGRGTTEASAARSGFGRR